MYGAVQQPYIQNPGQPLGAQLSAQAVHGQPAQQSYTSYGPAWAPYEALKVPPNYAAQGAAMVQFGVAIMLLICLLPYCTMQSVGLMNYGLTGFILDKVDISASLWDIHMHPVCTQNIFIADQVGALFCHATGGIWGHHLILDMNSHACQFEESLRDIRVVTDVLFRGNWGCDRFNIMSVGAMSTIICVVFAAACHIAGAVNVFTYYYRDTSRLRRKYALTFSATAPCAAVTGLVAYLMMFDISQLIVPATLRPAPGVLYPASWGTVFFGTAVVCSCFCTLVLLMFLDKLPSEEETLKYEQYTNYSAMLQLEAMQQQQQQRQQ